MHYTHQKPCHFMHGKIILNLSPICPAWSGRGHVGKRVTAVTFISCPTVSLTHIDKRHNLKSSLKYINSTIANHLRACLVSNACIPTTLWTDFQRRSDEVVIMTLKCVRVCKMLTLRYHVHDEVIKWKHFPRYWPFVRGIHRSPVNSHHKGQGLCAGNSPVTGEFPSQRPGAQSFDAFLICAWINDWVNNREAGDLRRYRVHYVVTVMD